MDISTLDKISYGLYVVSSADNNRINGQIVNTVLQVALTPPMVVVCINKKNLTHEYISSSRVFTISILTQNTPLNFIGLFGFKSGREIEKFANVRFKAGQTGAPILLEHSIGYIETEVVDQMDAQTHDIFLGRVIDAEVLSQEEVLTYSYYQKVKKGKTSERAPTYRKEEIPKGGKMKKYRCTVCGYIYDPEVGDPDAQVDPGTPFEDLPDGWVCPVCGAEKSQFEEV